MAQGRRKSAEKFTSAVACASVSVVGRRNATTLLTMEAPRSALSRTVGAGGLWRGTSPIAANEIRAFSHFLGDMKMRVWDFGGYSEMCSVGHRLSLADFKLL